MNALRSYPAHSCVPMSHILHISSILLRLGKFALRIHLRTIQPWRRHCFCFELTLPSSPLYLSLGYLAVFSCNHFHSVGARLILPSPVATYNAALKLPRWAHWRLKWAPGVPLWPPSTMVGGRHFFYNMMIYGHIILRIITKYIAYYHITELSAHASKK